MAQEDDRYEEIRRDEDDVEEIARRVGWKPRSIAKVKRHLFIEEHLLDRYVMLGVPATLTRFDADAAIADAWARLKAGRGTAIDLRLLRHEAAEAWYMRKHGPSYMRAHAAAQRRYPAPPELWS